MIKTDSEREKEILEYIEKKSKEEKWMDLNKENILHNLKDKVHDDDGTEKILEGVIEKGRIKEIPLKFKIFVLKEQNNEIRKKISNHLIPSYEDLSYFLSFLAIFILLSFEKIYSLFISFVIDLKGSSTIDTIFILISFFFILFSILILNKIFYITINFLVKKIPWLKTNQRYIIPFLVIGLIIIIIVIFYQLFFSDESLKLEQILTILAMTMAGGFAWLRVEKWLKK